MTRRAIGPRTAKLLREAMVLGYVEGRTDGQHAPDQLFPKDSEIVSTVMRSASANTDLYPTLGRLARRLDAEEI